MYRAVGRGCVQEVRYPMISALGTVPRMAPVHVGLPWLAIATLVAPSSWGEASNDVIFVAPGTQQYRWGSSHATFEWGLCTTLPRESALDAVNLGDRAAFGRYTPCGCQDTLQLQTDLMASRAVVYPAPHTAVEREGWYTTTQPCFTATPSRNDVTATCGSCGTLTIRTTSGTGKSSASGTGPAGNRRTFAHWSHPHTASHALRNAPPPPVHDPQRRGVNPPPACGVSKRTDAGLSRSL